MEDMLSKITTGIDNMNVISKKVIKYGFESFLFVMFFSLLVSISNKYYLGNVAKVNLDSMYIFKSSFSILAITFIGGVLMDYISKKG